MPPKTANRTPRRTRRSKKPGVTISDAIRLLTDEYGPFENEPRLDPAHELVFTILSQHTSDRNSERAFRNLMHTFGTLEAVAEAASRRTSRRQYPAADWHASKRLASRKSLA